MNQINRSIRLYMYQIIRSYQLVLSINLTLSDQSIIKQSILSDQSIIKSNLCYQIYKSIKFILSDQSIESIYFIRSINKSTNLFYQFNRSNLFYQINRSNLLHLINRSIDLIKSDQSIINQTILSDQSIDQSNHLQPID